MAPDGQATREFRDRDHARVAVRANPVSAGKPLRRMLEKAPRAGSTDLKVKRAR